MYADMEEPEYFWHKLMKLLGVIGQRQYTTAVSMSDNNGLKTECTHQIDNGSIHVYIMEDKEGNPVAVAATAATNMRKIDVGGL